MAFGAVATLALGVFNAVTSPAPSAEEVAIGAAKERALIAQKCEEFDRYLSPTREYDWHSSARRSGCVHAYYSTYAVFPENKKLGNDFRANLSAASMPRSESEYYYTKFFSYLLNPQASL